MNRRTFFSTLAGVPALAAGAAALAEPGPKPAAVTVTHLYQPSALAGPVPPDPEQEISGASIMAKFRREERGPADLLMVDGVALHAWPPSIAAVADYVADNILARLPASARLIALPAVDWPGHCSDWQHPVHYNLGKLGVLSINRQTNAAQRLSYRDSRLLDLEWQQQMKLHFNFVGRDIASQIYGIEPSELIYTAELPLPALGDCYQACNVFRRGLVLRGVKAYEITTDTLVYRFDVAFGLPQKSEQSEYGTFTGRYGQMGPYLFFSDLDWSAFESGESGVQPSAEPWPWRCGHPGCWCKA